MEHRSLEIASEAAREELQSSAREGLEETLVILVLTCHLRAHRLTWGELQHEAH